MKQNSCKHLAIGRIPFRWLVLLSLAFAWTAQAYQNTNIDGVTWSWTYEGDVTPSANTPALTEGGGFVGTTDGHVETIFSGFAQLIGGVGNPNWDGSSVSGSTFEVRMRIDSQTASYGGFFELGNQTGSAGLLVATNGVLTTGGANASYALDTTVFHIYRLTLSNNIVTYYLDNNPTPIASIPLVAGAYNGFDFGYGTGAAAGSSSYDYVRWTNGGAFAAVPEPGALGLVVLAVVVGARPWKRKW